MLGGFDIEIRKSGWDWVGGVGSVIKRRNDEKEYKLGN